MGDKEWVSECCSCKVVGGRCFNCCEACMGEMISEQDIRNHDGEEN